MNTIATNISVTGGTQSSKLPGVPACIKQLMKAGRSVIDH